MKTIQVHSIDKLRKGELTEVWEVIGVYTFGKIFPYFLYQLRISGRHNEFRVEKSNISNNVFVVTNIENMKEWFFIEADFILRETLKAIQQTDNKLLKWFRTNFNYTKVKVVGIDSKQFKEATLVDVRHATGRSLFTYHELRDNIKGLKSKDDHCIIYKLEVIGKTS